MNMSLFTRSVVFNLFRQQRETVSFSIRPVACRLQMIAGLILALVPLMLYSLSAAPAVIAVDGEPRMQVVLGMEVGDERVEIQELDGPWGQVKFVEMARYEHHRRLAGILADYLGKISGAEFEIARGDGHSGIALGVYSDFPELALADYFGPGEILRREEYLLRTHEQGVYLIGASELALEHAVWDFLYRLGHRQFFPGPTWEVIPRVSELAVTIDSFASPDYHTRTMRGGFTEEREPLYHEWCRRNRATPGFPLRTTHEYNGIVRRNREAFAANPQFFAEVDGERESRPHPKFNVAHPGLRQLVIDDAVKWFEENPGQICKSVDPSDYGGWCEAPESAEIGTPSDQAVFLANSVAEAVNLVSEEEKYFGMYAYYQHDRPPRKVRVHPRLIVSFATDFLSPGVGLDDEMAGWREMGLGLAGIREYHAVYGWSYDIPYFSTHGASLSYLTSTIARWHQEQSAHFYHSEAFDNWGCNGLAQYISARLLWDTSEADKVEALVDDFLDKAFGPAREPMAEYYSLVSGDLSPRFAADGVGRMFTMLGRAWTLAAGREQVRARLADLILYTRYLELFRDFEQALPDQRQAAFEQLIRHIYRIRGTMMIQLRDPYIRNRLARGTAGVTMPEEAAWAVPEQDNPWKSSEPFSDRELESILHDGQAAYGRRLEQVPELTPLQPAYRAGDARKVPALREAAHYVLYAEAGEQVDFSVHCQTMRSAQVPFFLVKTPSGRILLRGQAQANQSVPFSFAAPESGTYRISFAGTTSTVSLASRNPFGIFLKVPVGLHTTASARQFPVSQYLPEALGNYGTAHFKRATGRLYFKVPAGVENFRLLVAGRGAGERINAALLDPAGEVVDAREDISETDPHLFTVQRAPSAKGEVWSIELARPTSGHHGDFYVTLGPALAPVLSPDPEMVFLVE